MQTIVRLVETGLGISLVPGWTRVLFASRAVFVPLATSSHRARIALALAWSKSNTSPIVGNFRDVVRDIAGYHAPAQRGQRRAR